MSEGDIRADDAAAIDDYETALSDFAAELNRLHIAFGAPSYAAMARASHRPKLTKAGINEALSGKRLPSLDAVMEFARVVSNPLTSEPDPSRRTDPALAAAWRERWQHVKFLQRQAQAPWKRVRATAQAVLDQAAEDAASLRAEARAEAARIAEMREEAERLLVERRQARDAAVAGAKTALDEAQRIAGIIINGAKEQAEGILAEARAAAEREAAAGKGINVFDNWL
jgi:hypothetical protein